MAGEINLFKFRGLFRTGKVYLIQRAIGNWVWLARVTRNRGAFYIANKDVKHHLRARLTQLEEIRTGDFLYSSRRRVLMLVRIKVK